MTLRQTIQTASDTVAALMTKLSATSNKAVKTREGLYSELSNQLARYAETEEQQLLPLLRRQPETEDLAARTVQGNKDLRTSLERLSGLPKNNDAFLAALAEMNKSFQQHIRDEQRNLLPEVLALLDDEKVAPAAGSVDDAAKDAGTSVSDEPRAENSEPEHAAKQAEPEKLQEAAEAGEPEQDETHEEAAPAERGNEPAEEAREEAAEIPADVTDHGPVAARDEAGQVADALADVAQPAASDSDKALTLYHGSTQKMAENMQIAVASSAASVQAVLDVSSVWVDWFNKTARANAELSQRLIRSTSLRGIAEAQSEFVVSLMQNWSDRRMAIAHIAQRISTQEVDPRDRRVDEAA